MFLNEKQQKIIDAKDQHIFILAGAGSGKTRVIIEKIKMLLKQNVDPKTILALTFTHKTSVEMKQRVQSEDVFVYTFHKLCFQKLKENTAYHYQIFDNEKGLFKQESLLKISVYKNSLFRLKKPYTFKKYQKHLKENKLKDFDDLMIDFLTFQKTDQKISYRYIFIDEFQDTNPLQFLILKSLISKNTFTMAVGDPDQSIYAFRGAKDALIQTYIQTFHAKCYLLDTNYRSTKEILNVANRLISKNHTLYKKTLKPNQTSKGHIFLKTFNDVNEENTYILNTIREKLKNHVKAHHIAIIYRNHFRSNSIKYELVNQNISIAFDQMKQHHINLISMHQSKGLEFEVVFIIGLEHQMIPSIHTATAKEVKEERRLLFVAITRAKRTCILTYCKRNEDDFYQKPSMFIKECF